MIRIAQLMLVMAAGALWLASRLTWVDVTSAGGLGQPKSIALSGGSWSTALVPLALLLLAAAVAALALRGWLLRLLAVLTAAASAGMAYLAISLWVERDVGPRAADLAMIPVADLKLADRHYGGAVTTLAAAVLTLVAAVLLIRSAAVARTAPLRYAAPAVRRDAVVDGAPQADVSERMIWDALDEGRDPTDPDSQGR